jgi:CheY-like chemotaxis protein/HPt (histidine-containing phosphotransfer) domain-containing protein
MKNSLLKQLIFVSLLPTAILALCGVINVLHKNVDVWITLMFFGGSLLATSLLIFLIQSRITRPFAALISKLQSKHPALDEQDLSNFADTIDSYLQTIDMDHEAKLTDLEEKIRSLEASTVEQEVINHKLEQHNDHLAGDSIRRKQIRNSLARLITHHLKTIVSSINAIEQSREATNSLSISELKKATETLLFINREIQDEVIPSSLQNVETWQLVDDLLERLSPIVNSSPGGISVRVNDACPGRLVLAADEVRALTFQYLLHYLSQEKPTSHTVVDVHFENSTLSIKIAGYPFPDISKKRQKLLKNPENSSQNFLAVPAEAVISSDEPGKGLNAIVVCEDHEQRESIIQRLQQYGVSITNDFRSRELHFCIADDEEGQSFKGIRPYISPATPLLFLRSNTLYQRKNIHHIKNPLNHRELKQILSGLMTNSPIVRRYSVLAVDDNESNLHLLALQLKELGHHVITATNGEAAVKLYRDNHFDLVFLDIQMPGLDGIEATRLIRKSPGKTPPILGLTAHVTNEEKQAYLSAGMDQVLMKPLRIDNLRSILDHHIEQRKLDISLPEQADHLGTFDYDLAISRANNRPEIADELFQLLIRTLPEDLDQINRAASSGIKDEFRSAVHRLNGAIRYCGVPALSQAIDLLESRIKISMDEASDQALVAVNHEADSLVTWHQANPNPFDIQINLNSS